MFAIVSAAQTDFRSSLRQISEKGRDMSLFVSSLRLRDFDVKVGVGGSNQNAFRRAGGDVLHDTGRGERMGEAASRAVSWCLQNRAERIADKAYPDGYVEIVWRLKDSYAARPVLVYTGYEPARAAVSRTAIRVERNTLDAGRDGQDR